MVTPNRHECSRLAAGITNVPLDLNNVKSLCIFSAIVINLTDNTRQRWCQLRDDRTHEQYQGRFDSTDESLEKSCLTQPSIIPISLAPAFQQHHL